MKKAKLLTIPPSHYCEKARWALELAGVPYEEEGHAPIFHYAFVYPRTRSKTVPVLLREGHAPMTDSTDILRWVDTQLPDAERLFPSEHDAAVAALEERFDLELGTLSRRLAYCHVAKSKALFEAAFFGGLRGAEKAIVARGEAVMRRILGKAFNISDRAEARTRAKLQALFDDVGAQLGDGNYLVGGRFTAADLTFVSLAEPILSLGQDLARLEAVAPAFAEVVRHFRETPAGRYAARIRAEHRRPETNRAARAS